MDLWRGTANQCNVTPKIGEGPSLNPPLIADNVTRERYAPRIANETLLAIAAAPAAM